MHMLTKRLCVPLLSLALAGCAITQTVRPVERVESNEVCIIENLAVRPGLLETYIRVLVGKGYIVRQLPPGAQFEYCPVTSTYTANWRWDMALYMAFADIKVYQSGQQTGQALYDARGGGANMSKFIKGEVKIAELVDQLFPGGAKTDAPGEKP